MPGKTVPIQQAYEMAAKLYHQKRPRVAMRLIDQIIQRRPNHMHAHHLRGAALMQLDMMDEAEVPLRRALELAPSNVSFNNTFGVWLKKSERLEDALKQFEEVKRLNPTFAPVHTNIGLVHQRLQNFEAAHVAHGKCLELDPDYRPAMHNMGNTLDALGKTEESVKMFTRALRQSPEDAEILMDRGLVRLRAGDYERGWEDYEHRLTVLNQRLRHRQVNAPMWDGGDFKGKTLGVYQEQGYGDVIQCLRYVPWVKERGGELVFLVAKPLERVLETVDGIDRIVTAFEDVPAIDFKIPIFSLPRIFKTRWPDVPAETPYIRAAADSAVQFDGATLNVGLIWAGSTTFKGDHYRTMTPEMLAPLTEVPGVKLYSLQFGADESVLTEAGLEGKVHVLGDEVLGDFFQTGGIIEKLDLIITVDTVTVHLAGALSRPAWLMLSRTGDWRWGRDIDNSPWYPSVRVFRQEQQNDWSGVVDRIAAALGELCSTRS
ncbi:MAG: tetratricopeptide repeat protein [Alphaproteobacteria bacterium]|nr:tetratricopeptide repeat protein [Alphaproteobacteria bacterium]